jgi:hypothetical protein
VPTSTGAIAAGSVRTRAAITQMRTALARSRRSLLPRALARVPPEAIVTRVVESA